MQYVLKDVTGRFLTINVLNVGLLRTNQPSLNN